MTKMRNFGNEREKAARNDSFCVFCVLTEHSLADKWKEPADKSEQRSKAW